MNSKIVAYQLAFGATTIGIKQAKVEKVDLESLRIPDLMRVSQRDLERLITIEADLAALPKPDAKQQLLEDLDERVLDLYRLPSPKRRLLQDLPQRTWGLITEAGRERAKSVASASPRTLAVYARELATTANTVVAALGRRHLSPTGWFRLDGRTMALRFDLHPGPDDKPIPEALNEITTRADGLMAMLGGQTYPYLHERRFVRVYDGPTVYIIKPNETRCWSVVSAMTDADHILGDQSTKPSERASPSAMSAQSAVG